MFLRQLVNSGKKNYKNVFVKGICFDSRKVKRDDIFFAIKGTKTSGTKYIDEAILKGASAIVTNNKINKKYSKIPFIFVRDAKESLSKAASVFYKKKPSNIVAVTGTNGKSSVADFFYQILSLNKISSASIGTLGVISKKYKKKTNLTSMDSISLNKHLNYLAKKKVNNVILEASSHGLEQKRLNNINIKVGLFTNFSQDHLDYHKNMKLYLKSKMILFKDLLNKNLKLFRMKKLKNIK